MTVRERLWRKATAEQQLIACIGLAGFLCRFYEKYRNGIEFRNLTAHMDWLWEAVTVGKPKKRPPINTQSDADCYLPDADTGVGERGIGQVAAVAVFLATDAFNVVPEKGATGIWDIFEEAYEHASETEEDDTAYQAGFNALSQKTTEEFRARLRALNNMPRKSAHAKRVRLAFKEAEDAVKAYLAAGEGDNWAAIALRQRLDEIDVKPLLIR